MKNILILIFLISLLNKAWAQSIAINNDGSQPNASAMLDIKNTNKGLLIPRVSLVSETDVVTIPSPMTSLLVFNTNGALPDGQGYYFWNGSKWSKLATRTNLDNLAWGVGGNSFNNDTSFIGTTNSRALVFKTDNVLSAKIDPADDNAFFGRSAGLNNSGSGNSFFGYQAGKLNIGGTNNTAVGAGALAINTSGNENTALGFNTLNSNTTGSSNIAIGFKALKANNAGTDNIAIGKEVLNANTSGTRNIAIGYQTMFLNTTGGSNISIGYQTLDSNTTGFHNTGIGYRVLVKNTDADYNTSIGSFSMNNNITGAFNTAYGNNALDKNLAGSNNTAIGSFSGPNPLHPDLTNSTCLGYQATVSSDNTMSFGNVNVDKWAFGISTTSLQHALEVGSNGTNGNGAFLTQGGTWTNTSSRIKKENFTDLNSNDLLQKISQLSIQKWKYKGTNEYHIGPVAEDFYALFGLGTDDKGISTVDPAGIALAAIKELIKENETLKKSLEVIRKEIDELKKK